MVYNLKYSKPAEDSGKGWEEYSIPLGNGYLGANIFGGVDCERIQITENSLVDPGCANPDGLRMGGLTNFMDIYIKFIHKEAEDYERGLCLNTATAYTQYCCAGINYRREFFASYPAKVLVVRLTASEKEKLEFEVSAKIPFVRDYSVEPGDGGGRTGEVTISEDVISLSGKLLYYETGYNGQVKLSTDGAMTSTPQGIHVTGATQAILMIAVATNYKLCSQVFVERDRKKKIFGDDPEQKVADILNGVSGFSYLELYERHLEDYRTYFGRVDLDLGSDDSHRMTDELLEEYKQGRRSRYLEALYFQYGRYLLICSSRKGCLPANLQGIWNCHEQSPWGSGYWHNINVQMNYWHAFNTNLAEMFEAYADFFYAFYEKAQENAANYILEYNPENYPGDSSNLCNDAGRDADARQQCGWMIATAAYPYYVEKPGTHRHSGPGTTALTSKLFWDYYDFTQDEDILRNVSYKALKGTSDFLVKTVRKYNDEYLVSFSASPEQFGNKSDYYQTVGCAFDQQLIYENGKDFIRAAEMLGEDSDSLKVQKEQIDHYHPVRIGWSGQIKEYIEENFYGEIGEYHHRHISHLMALYPGTTINSTTAAWMDAAKHTLALRGDKSTGWALAHRLNAWARTGDGNHAYKLLVELLGKKTNPNLWDEHPPFQIDGNFGATAGIAEMLLQSHEGFVSVLPALPDEWEQGVVSGLVARGGFDVNIIWKEHTPEKVTIVSKAGKTVRIRTGSATEAKNMIVTGDDSMIESFVEHNIFGFHTKSGYTYEVRNFRKKERTITLNNFNVSPDLVLTWDGGNCDIYRAADDAPEYECIARNVSAPYKDDFCFEQAAVLTYKIAVGEAGITRTLNHATEFQKDVYHNLLLAKLRDRK